MGKMRLLREVLWAEGSGRRELLVGLVMVIVLWLFPWITAGMASITFFDHYICYGKYMLRKDLGMAKLYGKT